MRPRPAPSDPCTKFSSGACSSLSFYPGRTTCYLLSFGPCHERGSVLTENATEVDGKERLVLGGMARWDGLDLFGPNYMSVAYRHRGKIHVRVEPSSVWKPKNPTVQRLSRLPVVRSLFFWGGLILQIVGSVWTLVFFAATLAALWLFVRLMELGSEEGTLGSVFTFFAEFPILPVLLLFFAAMKFTPIGRYHGAEHKAVAAYE